MRSCSRAILSVLHETLAVDRSCARVAGNTAAKRSVPHEVTHCRPRPLVLHRRSVKLIWWHHWCPPYWCAPAQRSLRSVVTDVMALGGCVWKRKRSALCLCWRFLPADKAGLAQAALSRVDPFGNGLLFPGVTALCVVVNACSRWGSKPRHSLVARYLSNQQVEPQIFQHKTQKVLNRSGPVVWVPGVIEPATNSAVPRLRKRCSVGSGNCSAAKCIVTLP
jgi:hypothetical protein